MTSRQGARLLWRESWTGLAGEVRKPPGRRRMVRFVGRADQDKKNQPRSKGSAATAAEQADQASARRAAHDPRRPLRIPGPNPGVDLYWSDKHHHHGGSIQVISTPDGWPLWTSEVRPGREHDTTTLREHPEMLPALCEWTGDDLPDLGYEGEASTVVLPNQETAHGALTDGQRQHNWLPAYALSSQDRVRQDLD